MTNFDQKQANEIYPHEVSRIRMGINELLMGHHTLIFAQNNSNLNFPHEKYLLQNRIRPYVLDKITPLNRY